MLSRNINIIIVYKDTLGESILICTESNARIGKELITADLKPISSCLEMDSSVSIIDGIQYFKT